MGLEFFIFLFLWVWKRLSYFFGSQNSLLSFCVNNCDAICFLGVQLKDIESENSSSNLIKFWNGKTLTSNSKGRIVPSTNVTDATAVVFLPWFSIMATIVSQPDKCLKFSSIWGADKNDCSLFKIPLPPKCNDFPTCIHLWHYLEGVDAFQEKTSLR